MSLRTELEATMTTTGRLSFIELTKSTFGAFGAVDLFARLNTTAHFYSLFVGKSSISIALMVMTIFIERMTI